MAECNNSTLEVGQCPRIRFGGFTNPWEQRKLSEYASFLSGNGLNWNDITEGGKQECILYGNLYTDYGMIADKVVYRTDTEINNPVYSEYGDVLIPASDTTPTGLARATSLEKSGVLLGGDINIIRPSEEINGSCLSLSLNANKKELIRLIKGTTVRHIHNSEIKNIEITLPKNKDEQIKISTYFKWLDNLITLHQRKCDSLVACKNSLLQKLFPKDGKLVPEIRFKGFEGEWEKQSLEDVCVVKNGFAFQSSSYCDDGNYNIITISNVTGDDYITITNKTNKISNLPCNLAEHQLLKNDDILVSMTGNVGRVSKNKGNNNLLNQRVGLIKQSSNLNQEFLYQLLSSTSFEQEMISRSQGGAQPNIGLKDIYEYIIPVSSSFQEQQFIGKTLYFMDKLIKLHQQKLSQLQKAKSSLLQQMFI